MREDRLTRPAELRRAFLEYERLVRIQNYKVGCLLAFIFMPAGASLDYFVYPDALGGFVRIRLLCSFFLGVIWALLQSRAGLKLYRLLGLLVALLPLFSIAWMIRVEDGAASPYYAGLNLVMLGAAILLRWTWLDSVVVFVLALAAYVAACFLHGPFQFGGVFFNNLYFLVVTGVFIVTGSWVYDRIRLREFELRYELDRNRQMLEENKNKLEEQGKAKTRFFANMNHELRTPLTLLLAPLETLLLEQGRGLDAGTRDLLTTMRDNGMRLLKLINDLLDLVHLDEVTLNLHREPVAIADFVKGLTNSLRGVAEDKRLRLETAVAENLNTILADRDKLERILLNLLFNALKFTPAGGRVALSAERRDDTMEFRVSDTGIGIAQHDLARVFDRFWQADSSPQRKHQGTGLGLALVKELVEAQGGAVAVQSAVGQGTTFTVRLPWLEPEDRPEAVSEARASVGELAAAAAAPAEAGPPAAGAAPSDQWLAALYRRAEWFPAMTPLREALRPVETSLDGGRPKVLIADDEPDMLRFLKSQLTQHFQVLEAVDGLQAIDKAAQFLPDIIVCDLMMPEKDGLQVCRDLRARTSTQGIPIVLLTARADEETKFAALAAGASDFLTKPFSTTELHVRLRNLVESYQFQRRLARQNQILEATLEQLKDTESQLVQSEKMASLGRLSAGLIHEINNPLNYVRTGLYVLRKKTPSLAADQRAEYEEVLRDIEEGVDRVKNIVSDLRTFTHPDSDAVDEVEVAEVVASALRFLSNEWKDRVQVQTRIPEHQTVRGNPNKLIQVVVNLLQNSIDALRQKSFTADQPTLWVQGERTGGKSRLVIRDNGAGIAPEVMDKIFDPFFTTKEVGAGMGLGLSICYRIVQGYGGRILVKSEPGVYSEFALEFPDPSS